MTINKVPLFVDLDGTIIKEDLSHLSFFKFAKNYPLKMIVILILFLFKGKPYLKYIIAKNYEIPFEQLKFNNAAIEYINLNAKYRDIYLISGSHQNLVDQMNNFLGIFKGAYGTYKNFNMIGLNKVSYIETKLKISEFEYLGNSFQDIPIWKHTKKILYTNAKKRLLSKFSDIKLEKVEIKANFKK